MKRTFSLWLSILILSGCDLPNTLTTDTSKTLKESRRGFVPKLSRSSFTSQPVPMPPADIFQVVQYDSPSGKLPAYLSTDPKDGKKHPAILWVVGGDCNSIEDVWTPAPADNDQTAGAFREAGIVMMYPSLRGGNQNPGSREGFLGEVDDVLAAADYLAKQKFVDPNRIYLGGHSTGGTLVLLTAEMSHCFRAVFSFGPVANIACYPAEFTPFNTSIRRELEVRSPGIWLHCIESPTFVMEGALDCGNVIPLQAMARVSKNPKVQFYPVQQASHFSILRPVTRLIADKIIKDDGPTCNILLNQQEIDRLFGR